ncbi:MAG TPA: DUF4012 domain-containing protein [Acidimicrobiales bacterium]|jgi:hypothetical protein
MGVAVAGRRLEILHTRRARNATFTATVGATAFLSAVVSDAAPTGITYLDHVYVAALAAVVAYFAGWGRRWTWFVPAGVGAAVAADNVSLGLAAAAIAIGVLSVVTDSRTRARGALVAGLGMAALMRTDTVGFHGFTALLTALAAWPVIRSGYRLAPRYVRRKTRKVALIASVPLALMGIGLLVGIYTVYDDLNTGMDQIDEGVVAARDADDDQTALRFTEASRHLSSAESTLSSWFVQPARVLPFVGQNLRAVEHLSDKASDVARVSALAATSADLDALQFRQGRLDPEVLGSMIQPMEDVGTALKDAQTAVNDVRSPWLVDFIGSKMDELDHQLDDGLPDVQNAVAALKVSKSLLGGDGVPRRYLVLFTTPDEARGRTGFPGNFVELYAENGKVSKVRSGRISELDREGTPGDERVVANPALDDYKTRYGRFEPFASWRNMTMSPDLPTIALVAQELYPQSSGVPIDGVLTVDPKGLAALMNFIKPIRANDLEDPGAFDGKLDANNAEQFLLYDQYVNFVDRAERVDFLGDIADVTFDRLTSEAEIPAPRKVIDILGPVVDGGHIQFITFDPDEVGYLDSIGLSGRFGGNGNDFASLVTSNTAGNKIDYFLQRSMHYDATWDPSTGTVSGKIVATLTNNSPAEGLPDYFIGNGKRLPTGTNQSFVSIYTPYDVDGALIDGQPAGMEAGHELGRKVYSTFVDLAPGATVTIELDVSGVWTPGLYSIGVQPQPMPQFPDDVEVSLTIAGDREITVDGKGVVKDGRTLRWAGPLTEPVNVGAILKE